MDQKSFSIFKNPQFLNIKIIPFLLITFFFFSETESLLWNSTNCAPQYCGNNDNIPIQYPFWIPGQQESYCGSPQFNTTCKDNDPILKLSGGDYIIRHVNYKENLVFLARPEVFDQNNKCPAPRNNFNVHETPLNYGPNTTDLYFFYNCSKLYAKRNYVVDCANTSSGYAFAVFHTQILDDLNESCRAPVNSPVSSDNINELSHKDYKEVLKMGFVLNWDGSDCQDCSSNGNHCGSDNNGRFICFCKDNIGRKSCGGGGLSKGLKMIIGISVSGIGILIVLCIYYNTYLKHSSTSFPIHFSWKTNENQELEALINKFGSSTPRIYSYADIKKMTNSFKDELGKGGFGIVYKGSLPNGLPVAVKLLNAIKGNGDEFVNEVATISRTSHINVVSLLGFCFEGHHRAILYEFMPNGSLEKYIRNESDSQLGLEGLFEIAIGVARGLEYLHGGCNTRILHFDIKPHNILLDEDFCPKISDFGLARLCNRKECNVSMLEARGTIGYIAPEVFDRRYGVVSYKSDVYSYGMMVLEIVGARNKPINAETSNNSEAYFPDWAYQHVTRNEDQNLESDEDKLEKKMILVGLWCIQTDPLLRPSMNKVIEMLESSLEGLEIPQKPLLQILNIADRSILERSYLTSRTTLCSSIRSPMSSGLELKAFQLENLHQNL